MRISISMCLRQHLLHIQSSSLKLRHMFKFNTQRSTITGSECETFEGTEYRSQSAWQITVRMSNHSVTVTLSNTSSTLTYGYVDFHTRSHHYNKHGPNYTFHLKLPSEPTHLYEPYLHTSLCFTFKNKAWRRNSRIHEVHWRWTWTWRDRQSYVTTILHNFRFPHSAFVMFGEEHMKRVVSQIPFNVPIVFNVTA